MQDHVRKKIATSCEDGRAALKVDCFKKTRAYLFFPLTSNKESLKTILCTNFQVKLVAFAQIDPHIILHYCGLLVAVPMSFFSIFAITYCMHILSHAKNYTFVEHPRKIHQNILYIKFRKKIFLISGYYLFIIQYGNLPLSPNTKNQRSLSNMHIFL